MNNDDVTLRVYLRHLKKTSGTDYYMKAKGEVRKALHTIPSKLGRILKEMAGKLKKRGLVLDERKSSIEWYLHGSDGLRMSFELYVNESKDSLMTPNEVESILRDELDMYGTPRRLSDQWLFSY